MSDVSPVTPLTALTSAGYTQHFCRECGIIFAAHKNWLDPDCPLCPYRNYESEVESDASTVDFVDLTSQSEGSE